MQVHQPSASSIGILLDIVRFRSHRFRPTSGASDVWIPPPFYVWMAPGQGSPCDACAKPIPSSETEFAIVGGGQELRFHRDCYRARIDELRKAS